MKVGPITVPCVTAPQSPLKPLRVANQSHEEAVLFDQSYRYLTESGAVSYTVEMPIQGATPAASRATLAQLLELGQNTEWDRCAIYIQCREDGVQDAQDGFYWLDDVDASEETRDLGWANAKLGVTIRERRPPGVGVYVDAKTVPNDLNLGGTTLAVYPQGLAAGVYPPLTWTFASADGASVSAVEQPGSALRAALSDPIALMSLGRCAVYDQTANPNPTVQTEVFWKDHRILNGVCVVSNALVRYTVNLGTPGSPLIEVWNATASAWQTVGNYQIQSNGNTLPAVDLDLGVISPEEITWTEYRYDAAGSALVRLDNRIRRGSRLVETAITVASGIGIVGTSTTGVALVNTLNTGAATLSSDTTGVVQIGTSAVLPGFCYLQQYVSTTPPVGSANRLSAGLSIPAGTLARLAILAGVQDAQYTALGSAAAYAGRWAAYNRMRVRQRLLV